MVFAVLLMTRGMFSLPANFLSCVVRPIVLLTVEQLKCVFDFTPLMT